MYIEDVADIVHYNVGMLATNERQREVAGEDNE